MGTGIIRTARERLLLIGSDCRRCHLYHCLALSIAVITLFLSLYASTVRASSWQWNKGLSLSVGVATSEDDTGSSGSLLDDASVEESERTVTFSPYVSVTRQSRLLSLSGRAGLAYIDSQSVPDAEVNPTASLQAIAVLINDRLWLDTSGRVSRRIVGSNVIDDVLTSPDAATQVYGFAIGPRWEQELSQAITATGRYQYGAVRGSGSNTEGSNAHAVELGLSQKFGNGRALVELRYEEQRSYFFNGDSASSQALLTGVSYAFRSNLSGQVVTGWDSLDNTSQAFDEQSLPYGVQIIWQPRRHLSIDAGYQERVFGSKPSLSIALQGRISSVALSWSRTANVAKGVGLSNEVDFGNDLGNDGSDQPSNANTDSLTADNEQTASFAPFASESANVTEEIALQYALRGRISGFEAKLSHRNQEQLSSSDHSTANTIQLSASRALSKSAQLSFSVSATEGKSVSSDGSENEQSNQQAVLTFRIQL